MLLVACLWLALAPPGPGIAGPPPVAVYAKLDGAWEGTFVGLGPDGRELYRLRVRQVYVTVDEHTQRVTITDRLADGTVVEGRGVNTARRRPDGTLALTCRVEKSTGEVVEHDGRLVRGPDGDEQLVWHSRADDRVETFRETVRNEADGDVYEINGMGRYGDTLVLMHGRYRRVPPDP
ncbi:MAG: hypothetical protein ACYTG1_03710 [Planctomycetota bacterium]|jgi:hypothetical protein